jgi:PAS domain S-box-containing protein/diguanylate cyclase (GGDEF)-like protein
MKNEVMGARQLSQQIVLIYAFFSSVWILCSDYVLKQLIQDCTQLTQFQTLKGWVFVLLTSVLLYGVLGWGLRSLQASYTLLQALIQGTTDGIFLKDLNGRYLIVNYAGTRILGRAVEEVIGKDDTQLFQPEIAHKIRAEDQQVINSRNTQVYEEVLLVGEQERTYLSTKDVYRNLQGEVAGVISVARDITERKKLLEALQREKEDLAALSLVTANGISTLNLEQLLNVLLQRIVKVMQADAAVILLKDGDCLRVRASIGLEQTNRLQDTVAIGEGFAGTIAVTGQPFYIQDAATDSRVIAIKPGKIRSMLGVPLHRNETLVGVLHVDWLSIHPHSDRELQLLEITAERCTMAILNAQLYEQTKQLQERLQLQIDHMPLGCILLDGELRVTDWNPAAQQIFGFNKKEAIGRPLCELIVPTSMRSYIAHIFRQLVSGEVTVHSVNENLTQDGRTIICEWHNTPLKAADGSVIGMLSMVQDITERKQTEQELHRKDEQYRTLARNFPNGAVFLFDRNLRYILAEGTGVRAIGLNSESLEGKTIEEALHPDLCELFEPIYRQALAGMATTFEAPYKGRIYLVQVLPATDSSGEIFAGMAVTQDITDRKRIEAQLRRYAFYDSLTGLPNRTLFLSHLEARINAAKQGQTDLFAILLLKLEHFGIVKYSLGHKVADQLMIATARRLETYLPITATIARVASDEFAILLEELENYEDATHQADRIHQLLMLPFDLQGQEVFSTTSIGIALGGNESSHCQGSFLQTLSPEFPSTISTPQQLICSDRPEEFLRAADTARHHAKVQTHVSHAVYNPAMHEQAVARFQLETDLRRAIERPPFQVYYQPIVSLETGKINGFEALVRWIHPTRGIVSPMEFIPIAEQTGLISFIDWWVLREACTQLKIWQQSFGNCTTPLTMSVNLSGLQLSQLGLLERLEQVLRETEVDGCHLKLEITEGGLLQNSNSATAILQQLKTLGIKLSIDDFGTGYSSLARLHKLPIDTLKIDRSFVNGVGKDGESMAIIRAIMTLAHTLEMDVIAEGVETPEQLSQLRSLNCDYGQGYLFSRPVDSMAAEELLTAQLQW